MIWANTAKSAETAGENDARFEATSEVIRLSTFGTDEFCSWAVSKSDMANLNWFVRLVD